MMGNSSDWIIALRQGAEALDPQPRSWIDQLTQPGAFVEGVPFRGAHTMAKAAAMASSPDPLPAQDADPLAEAFARGEEAGRNAAHADLSEQIERQRAMRITFRALDQAAMDALAHDLAETVLTLCGQAIEGFDTDPERLVARCKEAARRLGAGPEHCTLHLHPHDLALIDTAMLDGWQVVADEAVERGGLALEGEDGSIGDSPADWRRAIAAAIGGKA